MRKSDAATGPQIDYIGSLARQLREMLEDGEVIAEKLDAVQAAVLSKKQASDLIEVLKAAVSAVKRGEPLQLEPRPHQLREAADKVVEDEVARWNRERREKADAFNKREAEIFFEQFGVHRRSDPPESDKLIQIWKRTPNSMYSSWSHQDEIAYGWAWRCTHPSHKKRGATFVQGGSVTRDVNATRARAAEHWAKFHGDEKVNG